jgi:methylmalonyl-CoA/ethylmalonyl-CoA epimerase
LGFTPLFSPVPAPAFGNRLICYFWKKDIGLIEIVEQEKGE